jgi:hypothetical protein
MKVDDTSALIVGGTQWVFGLQLRHCLIHQINIIVILHQLLNKLLKTIKLYYYLLAGQLPILKVNTL